MSKVELDEHHLCPSRLTGDKVTYFGPGMPPIERIDTHSTALELLECCLQEIHVQRSSVSPYDRAIAAWQHSLQIGPASGLVWATRHEGESVRLVTASLGINLKPPIYTLVQEHFKHTMQIASILSDLTSLRVCEHSAALALVSVHKSDAKSSTIGNDPDDALNSVGKAEDDTDMQRATDLVELHYGVKMSHMEGEDAGLRLARQDVDRVLENLDRRQAKRLKTRG